MSLGDTVAEWRSRRLRFLPLLESRWLLKLRALLAFPVAVILKRLAAALLVLILGTIFLRSDCYFGVRSIAMLRPSILGVISGLAISST